MHTYKVTIDDDGTICYYKPETKELHRVDGPAVEYTNGYKAWWLNNKRHRVDGPAVECSDGSKFWYLNNKHLTKAEWKRQVGDTCEGKIVEIDGKKYRLSEVE